ncbi:MmcQ/YjbR family DNA-binding protein [Crocinitomix catalasitica]|nr:MmcQ/YjbR family DNA-binding protein [Crocinitomix catalasitica]
MNIEDISKICKSFQSVTSDIKWEDHLCFNIGAKMFFVTSLDKIPTSASFKVSDENFEDLIMQPGFMAAPYLGRYKWVHIDDISRLGKKDWEKHIKKSYKLISSKLSKKLRTELQIENFQ